MPFRARFDCLWCGRGHATRAPDDIEGWASLCPDCLARAQENGFLRARLRSALGERARATSATGSAAGAVASAQPPVREPPLATPQERATPRERATPEEPATPQERDAWYLRQPPHSRGPLVDLPWQMELDEATRWLDGLPAGGVIVELTAGTGWWSPLLAVKGELWVYEEDAGSLELARRRLIAHGLAAHLHQRSPTAAPERVADLVFGAFLLGSAEDDEARLRRARAVHDWLRPGGIFAFIEARPEHPEQGLGGRRAALERQAGGAERVAGPGGSLRPATGPDIRAVLGEVGLDVAELSTTPSAFLMGTATRSTT